MVEIVATNVVASRPPNGDRLQRRPLVPKKNLDRESKILWFTTFIVQDVDVKKDNVSAHAPKIRK